MHGPSLHKRRKLIHHDNCVHFFPCLMYVISLEWMLLEGRTTPTMFNITSQWLAECLAFTSPVKILVAEECKHGNYRHATPLPLVPWELSGSVAIIYILGNKDNPVGTSFVVSLHQLKKWLVEGLFCFVFAGRVLYSYFCFYISYMAPNPEHSVFSPL